MSTTTLPTWSVIAADAARHRGQLAESLRRWAAGLHVRRRSPGLPSRWVAAFDAASRPYRARLVAVDLSATQRDVAIAAADDLWDAVAVAWGFVKWSTRERVSNAPGLEHVAAELHAAGRWLSEYPVAVAGHDAAIENLFHGGRVPA